MLIQGGTAQLGEKAQSSRSIIDGPNQPNTMVVYIHAHPQMTYLARAIALGKKVLGEDDFIIDSGPSLIGPRMTDDFVDFVSESNILRKEGRFDTMKSWKKTNSQGYEPDKGRRLSVKEKRYLQSSARDSLVRIGDFKVGNDVLMIDQEKKIRRSELLLEHYRALFNELRPRGIVLSHGNYDCYVAAHMAAREIGVDTVVAHAGMHYNLRVLNGEGSAGLRRIDPWDVCKRVLESKKRGELKDTGKMLLKRMRKGNCLDLLNASFGKGLDTSKAMKAKRVCIVYCHANGDAAARYTDGDTERCFEDSWAWLVSTLKNIEDSEALAVIIRLHPQSEAFGESATIRKMVERANRRRIHQIEMAAVGFNDVVEDGGFPIVLTNHGYVSLEMAATLGLSGITAGPGATSCGKTVQTEREYIEVIKRLSTMDIRELLIDDEVQKDLVLRLQVEEMLNTRFLYGRQMEFIKQYYYFGQKTLTDYDRLKASLSIGGDFGTEEISEKENGLSMII